jgi:hypothetical protein
VLSPPPTCSAASARLLSMYLATRISVHSSEVIRAC